MTPDPTPKPAPDLHPELLETQGRRAGRIFHIAVQRLARLLAFAYFRMRSQSRTNLPATGGVIVAPTHRSNLDTPFVGASARRPLRYFAKSGLFKGPVTTRLLVTMGAFPVRRDKLDRSALNAALAVLERGDPLVIFPEGERKQGPHIQPLLGGVAWLAARAQVPVVPVAVGGTERAMGKGVWLPRPRRVRIVWGEPLPPPQLNDRGRLSEQHRHDFTAHLHEQLQTMFDEVQAELGLPPSASPARGAGGATLRL